jgi:hypothetical protein
MVSIVVLWDAFAEVARSASSEYEVAEVRRIRDVRSVEPATCAVS